MVSEKMLEDAEDLASRGILLTPREVVRLNAYGLRVERGTVASALFSIRRCALLRDICFHEPTIGHFQWLDEAQRIICVSDNETWCYLRAYWLATKDADDLVKTDSPRKVEKTIRKWAVGHLRDKTLREVSACMDYVEQGADANRGERAPSRGETDADAEPAYDDWCSEIGVVREGQALGLGIPLADAMRMTHAQMRAVVDRAYFRLCGDSKNEKNEAIGDYNRVLEEIVRDHGGQQDQV